MYLEQTSDAEFDCEHVINELLAGDQRGSDQRRRPALHVHRLEMSEPHRLVDGARVAAIGLVRSRGQTRCVWRVSMYTVEKPLSMSAP